MVDTIMIPQASAAVFGGGTGHRDGALFFLRVFIRLFFCCVPMICRTAVSSAELLAPLVIGDSGHLFWPWIWTLNGAGELDFWDRGEGGRRVSSSMYEITL